MINYYFNFRWWKKPTDLIESLTPFEESADAHPCQLAERRSIISLCLHSSKHCRAGNFPNVSMLNFNFGLKVICQFGLGHWPWSRGVQICNFSSIFNFLQGRHSAFLIRLVLKVLILDWTNFEIIIEIKFILESIMGIMF